MKILRLSICPLNSVYSMLQASFVANDIVSFIILAIKNYSYEFFEETS